MLQRFSSLGAFSRTNYTGSEQVRYVKKVLSNSKAVKGKFVHLALLKLQMNVVFNEYTRAICLPDSFDHLSHVRPYESGFVVGWGTAGHVSTFSINKHIVKLILGQFDYTLSILNLDDLTYSILYVEHILGCKIKGGVGDVTPINRQKRAICRAIESLCRER